MYCRCCKKFHALSFSDLMSELAKDTKRKIWDGLSLDQIESLTFKLRMAKVELTNEGLKNIKIINLKKEE